MNHLNVGLTYPLSNVLPFSPTQVCRTCLPITYHFAPVRNTLCQWESHRNF